MAGKKDINELLRGMTPRLNDGDYVFIAVKDLSEIDRDITICEFKEKEGNTVIIEKHIADKLNYNYDYIASWITLMIHSSLDSVGLTAAFSSELAKNDISCNVIAGYYHDHIFVEKKDSHKAIQVLKQLSESNK